MEFPSEFNNFAPAVARNRCPEEVPHRVALLRDINDRLTRQLAAHRLSSQGHLHRPHASGRRLLRGQSPFGRPTPPSIAVRPATANALGVGHGERTDLSLPAIKMIRPSSQGYGPSTPHHQHAGGMSATSTSAAEGMVSLIESKEAELRRLEQSLARLRAENAELLRRKHERDEATAVKRAAASLMREHTTLLDEWSGRIAEFLFNTVR
ncbi:hypothetical protein FOZ61_001095 [Perkinsus olseni]|uniref:Uncharacterized protein n=1 Tax=Perkinsus olseni TaxID=32597 RepID=A0A7J6LXU2_PEROL|nr:hypothetical protein FOZ61_001095 [Perkinsus olseni]